MEGFQGGVHIESCNITIGGNCRYDMSDIFHIAAELDGISRNITALASLLEDKDGRRGDHGGPTNETLHEAFFAIGSHLERLSNELSEIDSANGKRQKRFSN